MNVPSDTRLKIKTNIDETYMEQTIQRKISKTPTQHIIGSRRRSVIRDDFTKLCIQGTNGWIINKEFQSVFSQHNQLFVIGIIGQVDECRGFIETIVKQNICIYNHEEQGIFISKPFFINKEWKIPVSFLICTFKQGNNNASKFQFITAMLSHTLIIFDWTSNLQRLARYNDTFRTNEKRLDKVLEIQQTVLVICYQNNSNYQIPSQGMDDNLLEWGIIEIRAKVDLVQKEESILQYLYHNMKKNYAAISSYTAVGYYYLFVSIWAQMKSSPYRIEINSLIDYYVGNVEKDIKQEYETQISENFQENKDDIFLFQCLKSFKECNKKRFDKLTFFCKKQSVLSQQKLIKLFNQVEQQTVKRNNDLNYEKNMQIAEDCLSKMKNSMNYKCYTARNLPVYSDDFGRFLNQYKIRSLGANSGETLKHWMYGYNKKVQNYFTEVITTDLSKSVARSHDQSKDDLIEKIALTEGMLSTVEKQLISLERKRDGLEKQSNKMKTTIQNIRKSLRETKERIRMDEENNERKERYKTKSVDPKNMTGMEIQNKQAKKRKRWLCFG